MVQGIEVRKLSLKLRALCEAQGWICAYCPNRMDEPTFDHVTPKSLGGGGSIRNGLAACQPCNVRKGNRMPTKSEMDMLAAVQILALEVYNRFRSQEKANAPLNAKMHPAKTWPAQARIRRVKKRMEKLAAIASAGNEYDIWAAQSAQERYDKMTMKESTQ